MTCMMWKPNIYEDGQNHQELPPVGTAWPQLPRYFHIWFRLPMMTTQTMRRRHNDRVGCHDAPANNVRAVSGSPQRPLVRCLGRPCVAIIGRWLPTKSWQQGVWKSPALRVLLGERKKKKKIYLFFFLLFGIHIILAQMSWIFIQGQIFYLKYWSFLYKKAHESWSVCIPEKKMPKWSGEPNELKVVLGEQKIFSDSLHRRKTY